MLWQSVLVFEPIYIGMVPYDKKGRCAFVGKLFDVRLIEARQRSDTKTFHRRWIVNGQIMTGSFWYTPPSKSETHHFHLSRAAVAQWIYDQIAEALWEYGPDALDACSLPFPLSYREPEEGSTLQD